MTFVSCVFQSLKQTKTESKLFFHFFLVPLKPKVQSNVYSSLARQFFIRLPKTTCSEGVVKVVNPLDALDFKTFGSFDRSDGQNVDEV